MNLTLEEIQKKHDEILNLCYKAIIKDSWKHNINSNVIVGIHQSDFAKAQVNSKDEIFISIHPAFLKTRCLNKLYESLIHEFTHLFLGLDSKHDKKFKRFESYLLNLIGCDLNASKNEAMEIINKIEFKWTVIAILEDGSELFIEGINRRNNEYSEYPRTKNIKHIIKDGEHKDKVIVKYKVIRNK
ncbi:hypothetical protein [Vibrio metschnikovii]|uniref:SprT-like family n=1 Tax=Vibrio metschnikovii TaxID=28172 RepID=A0A9X0RBB0_VIBME|nr:hypothetical protein [Vibrio metschnikovii]MBC5853228.1 hypothetical protein [Vibrio metschnikovii]